MIDDRHADTCSINDPEMYASGLGIWCSCGAGLSPPRSVASMSSEKIDEIVNSIRELAAPMGDGDRRELVRRLRDDVFCPCGRLYMSPFNPFDPEAIRCFCAVVESPSENANRKP